MLETLALLHVLPRVSGHAYLRPGFRLSQWSRRMLLGRYHRAIELMDGKLSLEEIANRLVSEFPLCFANKKQALSYAGLVSQEFSR